MRTSTILAKLIMLASIFGIVASQRSPSTSSTAFPITVTGVILTACTTSGQCGSGDLGGTTANIPITSCSSCTTDTPPTGTPAPIRGTKTTMKVPTGSLKSDTSSPLTGSGGSPGGMVAPAATTTSAGVAARNGGSVVAVVLLGSLVGLLGSW